MAFLIIVCGAFAITAGSSSSYGGDADTKTEQGAEGYDREAKRANAKASYERALLASQELRFSEALEAYRESVATDPSAAFAPIARARAEQLAARSEGNFMPFRRLEEVRRNPSTLVDRTSLEAFERDLARFPDGRVRSEARLVAAEAWRQTFGGRENARAEALLEAAIADPYADRLLRSLALSELVLLMRERNDLNSAFRVVNQYPDITPSLRIDVERAVRRVHIQRISFAFLFGLILVFLRSIQKLSRFMPWHTVWNKLRSPLSVAFALYLGGAAAMLVRIHGEADPRPFLLLGLGVLGIGIIARAWSEASEMAGASRPMLKVLRALACAVGVLAIAFLSLQLTDATYLEGLGL